MTNPIPPEGHGVEVIADGDELTTTNNGQTKTVQVPPKGVKVTTELQDRGFQQDIVAVYRDAGVVGVGLITTVIVALLLALLLFRVLKMYVDLASGQDTNEVLKIKALEGFAKEISSIRNDMNLQAQNFRDSQIRQEESLRHISEGIDSLWVAQSQASTQRASSTRASTSRGRKPQK